MGTVDRGVYRLSFLLNLIAGFCLVGMTALTCADVVLRLFRHPILGTYEIIGFLGATAAGFAMAYTTLVRGHVAVEVLVMQFSRRAQKFVFLSTHVLSIGLFALLSWESLRLGNDLRSSGEVSMTLELPYFPVLYGISFSAAMVCVVLCLDVWNVATGRKKPWYRIPDRGEAK